MNRQAVHCWPAGRLNKQRFDHLHSQNEQIEVALGPLSWDLKDCRKQTICTLCHSIKTRKKSIEFMNSIFQEDKGLNKIYSVCINMNAIWRPTSNHDIGIDGQIEFLEPGTNLSTGHIVAVQSKSGPSYFSNQDENYVRYYPQEKHKRYWRRLKLPVILILHNPDNDLTLYTRVKPQLDKDGPLLLDKNSVFKPSIRDYLVSEIAKDYEEFIYKNPIDVINSFYKLKHTREEKKEITGIDFFLACTNREKRYFELRMCRVNTLFQLLSENSSVLLFNDDYDYILRNILQLHAQIVVPYFLEEFDEMWYELHMVPDILVPITKVGVDAVEYMWENIDHYLNVDNYKHLGFSNTTELAKYISEIAQLRSDRIDISDRLADEPR
jgi:hypothetical protein